MSQFTLSSFDYIDRAYLYQDRSLFEGLDQVGNTFLQVNEDDSDFNFSLLPFIKSLYIRSNLPDKVLLVPDNFNVIGLRQIVQDTDTISLSYDSQKKSINLSLLGNAFSSNDQNFLTINPVLYSWSTSVSDIVSVEGHNFDVSKSDTFEIKIDDISNSNIDIFQIGEEDVLSDQNSDFSSGLWREDVVDCSDQLDGAPVMGMFLVDDDRVLDNEEDEDGIVLDVEDAGKALSLTSQNHFACTNTSFDVALDSEKLYKLSFDYKNVVGGDVQMYYRLRGQRDGQDISFAAVEKFSDTSGEWGTRSVIIDPREVRENILSEAYEESGGGFDVDSADGDDFGDVVEDISAIEVYLYAPSDGSKTVTNHYDNVELAEYVLSRTERFDAESILGQTFDVSEPLILADGVVDFTYNASPDNVLGDAFTSFEGETWRAEPGDCSASRAGVPVFELSLSDDATDGAQSVRLGSTNHYACINKSFPVEISSGTTYKLMFDYKSLVGSDVMMYYKLSGAQGESEAHTERIVADDRAWHTHEVIIDSDLSQVHTIDVFFYAPSDGSQEIVNLYDNVRLVEYLPKDIDSYYLYAEQDVDDAPRVRSVEYRAINRWKHRAIVQGVRDDFLLSFPDRYNNHWRAIPTGRSVKAVNLPFPIGYGVDQNEVNRQASAADVEGLLQAKMLTAVGQKFIGKNFDGTVRNDNLLRGAFWETWGKDAIPSDQHFKVNNYGNAWWIERDVLCADASLCTQNIDGTYNMEIIVENVWGRRLFFLLSGMGVIFLSVPIFRAALRRLL